MALLLRDYQEIMQAEVADKYRRKVRRVCLVSPTGSGKGFLLGWMTRRVLSKNKRVTILIHRTELVDQLSETLKMFEVPHGIIAADSPFDRSKQVQIASVWTLARRLEKVPEPDLLIIDECAHCTNDTTWGKIAAHYQQAKHLGLTACPQRLSGEGLGQCFDEMVLGPKPAELIEKGALSKYRLFAPTTVDTSALHMRAGDFIRGEVDDLMDKPKITGSAITHYKKYCDGAPAVAFCTSVKHAEHTAIQFRESGYVSMSIDGKMDRQLRRSIIADFRKGAIQVLTSCEIISEGLDIPGIHAAILLRPTQSLSLYLQQVGRALRPCDSKDAAVIMDHAGNSLRHGMPDDDREWSLDGAAKRTGSKNEVASPRQCGSCFAMSPSLATKCRECGEPFLLKPRVVEEVAGELEEVDLAAQKREARMEQGQARDLESLIAVGISRYGAIKGPRWARHVIAGREAKQQRRTRYARTY